MAAPSTRRWVRLFVKTIQCIKAERPLSEVKLDEFLVRGRLIGVPRLFTPAERRVLDKAVKEFFEGLPTEDDLAASDCKSNPASLMPTEAPLPLPLPLPHLPPAGDEKK